MLKSLQWGGGGRCAKHLPPRGSHDFGARGSKRERAQPPEGQLGGEKHTVRSGKCGLRGA